MTETIDVCIACNHGSDSRYYRPVDDPARGAVSNLGTWNHSHTAVRQPPGYATDWFDATPEHVAAARQLAADWGQTTVVLYAEKPITIYERSVHRNGVESLGMTERRIYAEISVHPPHNPTAREQVRRHIATLQERI